jgi:hypothetical protein
MRFFNLYFMEYALQTLTRNKLKNIFVFIVLTLMTALLSSVLITSEALELQLQSGLKRMGDIVVQKTKASMPTTLDEKELSSFLELHGVASAQGRVWGYYYFSQAQRYFTLVGIDSFEQQYSKLFQDASEKLGFDTDGMVISQGVVSELKKYYYEKDFNFLTPQNRIKTVPVLGVLQNNNPLYDDDLMVMSKIFYAQYLA